MMNKLCMSRKRTLETDNEALCRREANKLAMKQKINDCVKQMMKHCVEENLID